MCASMNSRELGHKLVAEASHRDLRWRDGAPKIPWESLGQDRIDGRCDWENQGREKDSTLGSLCGLTTIIDCFLMSLMILLPLEIVK